MQSLLKYSIPILCLGAAVAGVIYWVESPDEGRRSVAWGSQTCAHCQMHISDRYFAAQLHTRDSGVKHFDDPGCLFEWVADQAPSIETAYFHHYDKKGTWLDYREVGFIPVERTTPMGYGIGAVRKNSHDDAMAFHTVSNKIMTGAIEAHTSGRAHGGGPAKPGHKAAPEPKSHNRERGEGQ